MIDVYAPEGIFSSVNESELLRQLAECFLHWTDASELQIARENTGTYLHLLPAARITAGGKATAAVRVDVATPEVVLSTIERRQGFIADATKIVAALAAKNVERTWVMISNTADGGWGLGGHGLTNAELDEI